jgi:hypothetical protein
MDKSIILTLVRPARKAGGDRYEGKANGEDITFYIPQSISRPSGTPLEKISVTFEKV